MLKTLEMKEKKAKYINNNNNNSSKVEDIYECSILHNKQAVWTVTYTLENGTK